MYNKTITLLLAGIIGAFFIIFFIAQNYVLDSGDRLTKLLTDIAHAAEQESWDKAQSSFDEFEKVWSAGKHLVALNNAEQDFSDTETSVNELRGGIQSKDKAAVITNVNAIIDHWRNFKTIIPEP